MNDSQLRDRLLELETVTPELEARYRARMAALLERPLTPASRIGTIAGLVMGIGFFVLFSSCAIFTVAVRDPGFPVIGTLVFAGGALFGLAFAILNAVILKKGAIDLRLWRNLTVRQLRTMHPAAFGLTWAFCVLIAVALSMLGNQMEDPAKGNQIILGGIMAVVLFGIPVMIMGAATESELVVRERFLQLELLLAELKELIAAQKDPGAANKSDNSSG